MAVMIRCLMLLTMLLHSVFGCTWHHLHVCHTKQLSWEAANEQPLPQSKSHSCACHHQHAPVSTAPEKHFDECSPVDADSIPCGHSSSCDHSVCHFITSGLVSELSQCDVQFGIVPEPAESLIVGTARREAACPELHFSGGAAQRLCALHQVWRI